MSDTIKCPCGNDYEPWRMINHFDTPRHKEFMDWITQMDDVEFLNEDFHFDMTELNFQCALSYYYKNIERNRIAKIANSNAKTGTT